MLFGSLFYNSKQLGDDSELAEMYVVIGQHGNRVKYNSARREDFMVSQILYMVSRKFENCR